MTSETRVIERETVLKGAKFDFERASLRLADGTTGERQMVRHPGAVCVCPILDDGGERRVVLIRNQRWIVGETLWELPAGTLEIGEDIAACAGRELAEETGYEASRCEPLGWFYTTPGMTDEKMHAFAAEGLRDVGTAPEADERITVHPVPVPEVWRLIDSGELRDAKSIVTIVRAARAGWLGAGAG